MGRKNRSEEKRQIILDAFETVILREGYANASQRKIAEEAGVNQPMIHHYFSGGDELLKALLERITERYRNALSVFSSTESEINIEKAITFLCSDAFHEVSMQNQVMFHLIGQAQHHENAMALLAKVYRELLKEITGYVTQAGISQPDRLAYAIMCLVVGHDWVKAMGFGEHKNELMASTIQALAASN